MSFWLAWYTIGKYDRWVRLANILCGLEGLAVPAPELHINTQMRSWPRSNITEANRVSIWGKSIVVSEKTSFYIKKKITIQTEYGKGPVSGLWVKYVLHQRWWLRSLCWTGWLLFRGVKKQQLFQNENTKALQNLSHAINDFCHLRTMRLTKRYLMNENVAVPSGQWWWWWCTKASFTGSGFSKRSGGMPDAKSIVCNQHRGQMTGRHLEGFFFLTTKKTIKSSVLSTSI